MKDLIYYEDILKASALIADKLADNPKENFKMKLIIANHIEEALLTSNITIRKMEIRKK